MNGSGSNCRACEFLRIALIFPCAAIGLFYLGLESREDNSEILTAVSDIVTASNALALLAVVIPLTVLLKFFLERRDKK